MKTIGLNKDIVKISPYQSNWKEMFQNEKIKIKKVLSSFNFDIEHIGSTAVPELAAKPIIDIAIGIPNDNDIHEIIAKLVTIGWIDRGGDFKKPIGHLLVKESAPNIRTYHIHIVDKSSIYWKNFIRFRNILCSEPNIRIEYAKTKKKLMKKYTNNRKAYRHAKGKYISGLFKRIGLSL